MKCADRVQIKAKEDIPVELTLQESLAFFEKLPDFSKLIS